MGTAAPLQEPGAQEPCQRPVTRSAPGLGSRPKRQCGLCTYKTCLALAPPSLAGKTVTMV